MAATLLAQNITSSLVRGADSDTIQIGSGFQTQDGAAVPVTSPLTLTGSTQTLAVPQNAVELILNPATVSMNVSEVSSMATYDVIASGTKEAVPCARMPFVYVNGASGVLNFRFTLI